ncbi:MAG TPA: MATE family efflux transporter, partial [Trueperaceae bacterium]|nr:MATE family efflux transporter [Trueperaceae bacterium]
RLVTSIYLDVNDPANLVVVGYAATFLSLAGAFQLFDGVQVSAVGALRGLKDTRVPMLITLLSYWVVGFPTGLLCAFALDLGPRGMWYGLIVGLACAAVLLSWRFRAMTSRPRLAPAPQRA